VGGLGGGAGGGAVSCAAVLVRLSQAPPETLAFYRLLFALAVLVPASLTPGRRGAYARLRAQDWGLGILAGTFLALHYATWFASVRLTSVLSATVLVTLQPFFVLLLGFLLWRRRVPVRAGVACSWPWPAAS